MLNMKKCKRRSEDKRRKEKKEEVREYMTDDPNVASKQDWGGDDLGQPSLTEYLSS